MNERRIYDMIVVGGGPGGYTAALYAARAGLDTVVLEKLSAGGQMALTQQIDNYPGFEDGVDGFELGEKMQAQAHRFGAVTEYASVHCRMFWQSNFIIKSPFLTAGGQPCHWFLLFLFPGDHKVRSAGKCV